MRGLTLTQPWATAVALGEKRIETRSWRTPYRGLVAIHAAKGFPRPAREFALEHGFGPPERLPVSAVVAVARIVNMRPTGELARFLGRRELELGDYTPGRWAWVLDDVSPLPSPIACAGALGLWRVEPDLAALILAAAGGRAGVAS